jgi:hypothetical protein
LQPLRNETNRSARRRFPPIDLEASFKLRR